MWLMSRKIFFATYALFRRSFWDFFAFRMYAGAADWQKLLQENWNEMLPSIDTTAENDLCSRQWIMSGHSLDSSVGILTIWVTCLLPFPALSLSVWDFENSKIFPFRNICREGIGKKMKDGWTKAAGWPLGVPTIGIHMFNTLCSSVPIVALHTV